MKHELSSEALELIEAGRDADGPTPAQLARTQQRLAATLGAGAMAGVGAATQSAAAAAPGQAAAGATTTGSMTQGAGLLAQLSIGAKLAAAVVVVGAGVGVGVMTWPATQSGEPAQQAPAQATGSTQQPVEAPVPEQEPAAAEDGVQTQPRASKPARKASRAELDPQAPSLQQELALLGAAQDHLRDGRAARALKLLERHKKRFPQGALRQERTGAHAIALCTLGRLREGQQMARQLARSAPDSPLAARVREACKTPAQ